MPITRRRLLFIVFAVQLAQGATAIAQKDQIPEYKKAIIRKVFDDIICAFNDPEAPALVIRPGKNMKDGGAHLDPLPSTIYIDEHLVDLCRRFGEDSSNALALFIGHEIAHYYKGNNYGEVDLSESEFKDIAKAINREKLSTKLKEEAKADYFAGFYGRMAGYDPLKKAPQVFNAHYDDYEKDYETDGYPDLGDRKEIARNAHERLEQLIPVFDIANYLGMTQLYDNAQRCYDHVISIFWSREMLNNAGVVYTLKALQMMDSQAVRYVYPLELDADTRLRGVVKPTRAPNGEELLRIKALLDTAAARFRKSIHCDSTYVTARINLATVLILKEEYDKAIGIIRGILHNNPTPYTMVLARTAESIALLRKGEIENGRDILNELQGPASEQKVAELVNANLRALEAPLPAAVRKHEPPSSREKIDGMEVKDTSTVTSAPNPEVIDAKSTIYNRRMGFSRLIMARIDTTWAYFIRTENGHTDSSSKGIAIGSPGDEVLRRYRGDPRIINTRQGKYYIYDYIKMIFLIDPTEHVKQWMIYTAG